MGLAGDARGRALTPSRRSYADRLVEFEALIFTVQRFVRTSKSLVRGDERPTGMCDGANEMRCNGGSSGRTADMFKLRKVWATAAQLVVWVNIAAFFAETPLALARPHSRPLDYLAVAHGVVFIASFCAVSGVNSWFGRWLRRCRSIDIREFGPKILEIQRTRHCFNRFARVDWSAPQSPDNRSK
jgi:hypothetical protein